MRTKANGIPHLPRRIDQSPGARGENRIIDAIRALHQSGSQFERFSTRRHICGFAPRAIEDADNGWGVSLWPGKVSYVTNRHLVDAGDDFRHTNHTWPTLNGTAINDSTRPRTDLAAGTYSAHIVYKERFNGGFSAKVEFTAQGVDATTTKDEKSVEVCQFEVKVSGTKKRIVPGDQIICDHLLIQPELHQFKVVLLDGANVRVLGGTLSWFQGTDFPLVDGETAVSLLNHTVTGTGQFWLNYQITMGQHSQTTVDLGSGQIVTLTNYRPYDVTSAALEWRTSAPASGANNVNVFTGTGGGYVKIADVSLSGGDAVVDEQHVDGRIYTAEPYDSELTGP